VRIESLISSDKTDFEKLIDILIDIFFLIFNSMSRNKEVMIRMRIIYAIIILLLIVSFLYCEIINNQVVEKAGSEVPEGLVFVERRDIQYGL